MRLILLLFTLFLHVSTLAASNRRRLLSIRRNSSNLKCGQETDGPIENCFRDEAFASFPSRSGKAAFECLSEMIYNPVENGVFDVDNITETGVVFKVVGITHDCLAYFGLLHNFVEVPTIYENDTHVNNDQHRDMCRYTRIYIVRTHNTNERLLLAVRFYGSRLLIQSATSGPFKAMTEGLLWLRLPMKRKQFIHTNSLPRGFSPVSIFTADYRVYCVAKNDSVLKLFELRMYRTKDKMFHALLHDPDVVIPPIVRAPSGRTEVLLLENMVTENGTTKGVIFKHKGLLDLSKTYIAPALPLVSLLSNSLEGYNPKYLFKPFVYVSKFGFTVKQASKKCQNIIGTMSVYQSKLWKTNGSYIIPEVEHLGQTFDSSMVNGQSQHRRSNYPHALIPQELLITKHIDDQAGAGLHCLLLIAVTSIILCIFSVFLCLHQLMFPRKPIISKQPPNHRPSEPVRPPPTPSTCTPQSQTPLSTSPYKGIDNGYKTL